MIYFTILKLGFDLDQAKLEVYLSLLLAGKTVIVISLFLIV